MLLQAQRLGALLIPKDPTLAAQHRHKLQTAGARIKRPGINEVPAPHEASAEKSPH